MPATADSEDLIAVGADLAPGTMLSAYRRGLFPMGVGPGGSDPIGWWCPDPRGVIGPGDLHVSRSLSRALGRFEVRIDTDLEGVFDGCADVRRPGGWITAELLEAYRRLHLLGWVHSVEVWTDGALAGGLFGVAIGGLFAGESMFHRVSGASKAAMVGLVNHLEQAPAPSPTGAGSNTWLIDVQWRTEHLASLGARDIPRQAYLRALPDLVGSSHRWPPV